MDDRFNTIAGWVLFAGIVGLGLTSVSARYFHADKPERPETMGYEIEGVEQASTGTPEVPFATLLAAATPDKGKAVFAKCGSCHTDNQGGANGIGPNLYGIVGDNMAEGRGGFAFSDALKQAAAAKGGKWTFDNLNEWLTSPKAFAPGTKMTFAGLPKAEDRAAVIVYLNTMGSNVPLPPPPPPGAAPGVAEVVDMKNPNAATPLAAGDPAKGAQVFNKCKSCHTIDAGAPNGIGPNLHGVVGEKIGQGANGFAFSDALKSVGGTWDEAKLDKWLTSPRTFAPGTKMTFAGLPKAEDRADVIAYLKQQSQ